MDIFEAVNAGDCEQILNNFSQVDSDIGGVRVGYSIDFDILFSLNKLPRHQETPLMIAVQSRVIEPIIILLNNGVDVNATNKVFNQSVFHPLQAQ